MKEKESLIENKDQNYTEQEKDYKELDKLRREKTAGYFFTLSYLSFTALVLGSMAIFFQEMKFTYQTCLMLGIGLFFTGGLYYVASNFLRYVKSKHYECRSCMFWGHRLVYVGADGCQFN